MSNVLVNFLFGGNAAPLQSAAQQANAALTSTATTLGNLTVKSLATGASFFGLSVSIKEATTSLIEVSAEFQRLGTSFISILAEPLLAVSKGAQLTSEDLGVLREESVSLFQDAQRAAIDTVATTQEYVKLLQAALAIGHAVGLSIGETEIITKRLALAAGAFGINFEKASTAIAQILSGSVRVTNQLGRNLGLATAEQRKQLQLAIQQGTLFDFLEKKTRNFSITAKEVANNFLNVKAAIFDIFQLGGTAAIKPLFDFINQQLIKFRDTFIGEESFFTPALRRITDGVSKFLKDIIPSIIILIDDLSKLFTDLTDRAGGLASIVKFILALLSGIIRFIDQAVSLRGFGGIVAILAIIQLSLTTIFGLVSSIFTVARIGSATSFLGLSSGLINLAAIVAIVVSSFKALKDSSDSAQRSLENLDHTIEKFSTEQRDFRNSFKFDELIAEYKQLESQTERTTEENNRFIEVVLRLQQAFGNKFKDVIDDENKIRNAYKAGTEEIKRRIATLDLLREQLDKLRNEPNIAEKLINAFRGGFIAGGRELIGGEKGEATQRIEKRIADAKALAQKLGPSIFPSFDISNVENINKYITAIEKAQNEDFEAIKALDLRSKTTEELFTAIYKLTLAKKDGAFVDTEIRAAQELVIKGLRKEADANHETAQSYTEKALERQHDLVKQKEYVANILKTEEEAREKVAKGKSIGSIVTIDPGLTKTIEAFKELEQAKDKEARLKSALAAFTLIKAPGTKGRTAEEDEQAREFKRQLDDEKTAIKERLADFEEFQKIEVIRLASEVKAGRAPFTAAIALDIKNSKEFLARSGKEVDDLIKLINARIAQLTEDLSSTRAANDPKFAKATSSEISQLQAEENKLIKERGKDRRKAELEITKQEIALADLSADADKNRLTILNSILNAEESHLKLLQDQNLISGPEAKERDIKLQKDRLALIQQELSLAQERLDINLKGALSEANRQQQEELEKQISSGVSPSDAAQFAAIKGKNVLGALLASSPITSLRNEIITLGQSASEAKLKIAASDSVLGRLSFGFGELARLGSKFPGLELVFTGLKNFVDAIRGINTKKSAAELIQDAGGIFKGEVKSAADLLLDAAAIIKQRLIEGLGNNNQKPFIEDKVAEAEAKLAEAQKNKIKAEEKLNALIEEDSNKNESGISQISDATKKFVEANRAVIDRQNELAAAIKEQTDSVKKASSQKLNKAELDIVNSAFNGTIANAVSSKIAELTAGKTLGGLSLNTLLQALANKESGFRPQVIGTEADGSKAYGLFQFHKGTVTPVLQKLGKTFDEFLKNIDVQVEAVTLFLNQELEKTGSVKGAFRQFGPDTKKVIYPLIIKLQKLISENLDSSFDDLKGLLAIAIEDGQELTPEQADIIKNAFQAVRTNFLLAATRPRRVSEAISNAESSKINSLGAEDSANTSDIKQEANDDEHDLLKNVVSKILQAAGSILQGLSANTIGGKIAGFGQLANLIPGVGPIISAGAQVLGGIFDFFGAAAKKKTEEMANAISAGIEDLKHAISTGAIGLGEGIKELQQKVIDARNQLSGRKGGAEALAKIQNDVDAEIKQLREQAKKVQDDFRAQLDLLRQPASLRDTITAVRDIQQKAKEFINSFENKADALAAIKEAQEFVHRSLQELKDNIVKTLSGLQQDLKDATEKFALDEKAILLEGRIDPAVSEAESKRQRLVQLERDFQKQRLDLEQQISAEQQKLDFVNQRFKFEEKIAQLAQKGADALGAAADKLSNAASALQNAFNTIGRFNFGNTETIFGGGSSVLNIRINGADAGQIQIGVPIEQHLDAAGFLSPSRQARFNPLI